MLAGRVAVVIEIIFCLGIGLCVGSGKDVSAYAVCAAALVGVEVLGTSTGLTVDCGSYEGGNPLDFYPNCFADSLAPSFNTVPAFLASVVAAGVGIVWGRDAKQKAQRAEQMQAALTGAASRPDKTAKSARVAHDDPEPSSPPPADPASQRGSSDAGSSDPAPAPHQTPPPPAPN